MRSAGRVSTVRVAAAAAVGMAAWLAAAVCAAASDQNEVWLISTRRAPWSIPENGEDPLDYWRLGDDRRWTPDDGEALFQKDDDAMTTCVFVHGNRTDHRRAVRQGWILFRSLSSQTDRPFRFLIWSWPSERIRGGVRRDTRAKACRSDVESYYLACWLNRVDNRVALGLVGYSFGARVITGALHILAGGEVAGRALPDGAAAQTRAPIRAVLVAAALDNRWLSPGQRNALALGQLDRLLVTRNSRDPVLKWYHMMYGLGGPRPLGRTGPACPSRLGQQREKIEVVGLDCSVGRNHDLDAYLNAPGLRSRLGWYLLVEPPAPRSQPGP